MDIAALAVAMALESSAVEAGRVEATEHRPVSGIVEALRAELDDGFKSCWDANNKREYHRTGRRRGKSHYLLRRKIWKTAVASPETINPYILPTAKSVTLAIWPLAKRIVTRHFGAGAVVNETLRTIRLPVGGTMVFGGCETRADAANWYGMAFNEATLDEAGNYPDDVFVLLSDESIEPSLMDHGGDLIHSGNPGRTLRGRWYDETRDGRSDTTPLYVGDARDNPFLAQSAAEYFAAVRQRHGWTELSASFRRQYLGEWVEDEGELVFPLSKANLVAGLPDRSSAGGLLPESQWRYVIGVDVGVVDDTAIAVVAAHALDDREYVVSTEKHRNWISGQLAGRLRELKRRYPGAPIVLDTGGMGRLHAEELSRRFGIYVEPAEKREKESAIRLTRDLLLGGRILVLDGQCNDALREEWSVLGWDEDRRLPDPSFADHASDAASYALRRLRHYRSESVGPAPDLGTDAWEAEFRAAHRRRSIEQFERSRRRMPWG